MSPRRRQLCIALAVAVLAPSSNALAQTTAPAPTLGAAVPPASAMTEAANGEVRKVDKDARKITLRHGEIKQLDMPAMTMVFQVKDPSMLDAVKAGDKVTFKAENAGGAFVITEIQAAK